LRHPHRRNVDFNDFPNVKRWFEAIDARPAVQRGCAVLAEHQRKGAITDSAREVLFGKTQFTAR
jgi:GST-like protein